MPSLLGNITYDEIQNEDREAIVVMRIVRGQLYSTVYKV